MLGGQYKVGGLEELINLLCSDVVARRGTKDCLARNFVPLPKSTSPNSKLKSLNQTQLREHQKHGIDGL